MSLVTALCFSESPASSPRKPSADSSPANTEYLKMARKGGGRKGMVQTVACIHVGHDHASYRKCYVKFRIKIMLCSCSNIIETETFGCFIL